MNHPLMVKKMSNNSYTSHLDIESPMFNDKPHLWLQWKGTKVCCDIHCACGFHGHFDGSFFYFFACPECGQKYECGTHVTIYPINEFPEGVIPAVLEDD